jgi:hypothetical protein
MELTLKRILFTDDGITGVLIKGNREICRTLEEEWKDNKKSISSIPPGSYLCSKYIRPSGTETYQVLDVPGRSFILFHSGTTELDTEGCILTGVEIGEVKAKDEESGEMENQLAILRSKEGFERFKNAVGDAQTFALHIKNC